MCLEAAKSIPTGELLAYKLIARRKEDGVFVSPIQKSTALVNTKIVPSVLFGIFAGALSVVLSMIIFLCPISKESVHVVISSKVGVLEIDNTQYHIKDVFRASEDSTIVKYVCDDEFLHKI